MTMDEVLFYGCYDYSDEWRLVEMQVNAASNEVNWFEMCAPEKYLDRESWQVAYLEQYLNEDGTQRICDLYDIPETPVKPCRVAFFIYKTGAPMLSTPYGEFPLTGGELPERLKAIIEFEED